MSTSYSTYKYKSNDFTKITRNENNTIPIDNNLLMALYKIQSPSSNEGNMINFILKYVSKLSGVTAELDNYGNLYVTKGKLEKDEFYPCLVAHLDEVHNFSDYRKIIKLNDFIFGFDIKTGGPAGIGADDKNGIYVALELLLKFDKIKLFFPIEEEVGIKGSNNADFTFFNDVGYMMQCDRRGYNNLINKTNGLNVTCETFIKDNADIFTAYGYKVETGSATDVGALKKKVNVSACNLSCGYFNEHCDDEITFIPALENVLNMVYFIIKHTGNVKYHHEAESIYKSTYTGRQSAYATNTYYTNHNRDLWDDNDDYFGYASAEHYYNSRNNLPDTSQDEKKNLQKSLRKSDEARQRIRDSKLEMFCDGCSYSCDFCPYSG